MARLPAWVCTSQGVPGTAAYDPGMLAVVPVSVPASVVEHSCSLDFPTPATSLFVNRFYSIQANPAVARCIARQGYGEALPWKPRPLHFYS